MQGKDEYYSEDRPLYDCISYTGNAVLLNIVN